MAINLKKAKDQDLKNLDARELREPGWYQFVVTDSELVAAKSTQAMGNLTLQQLTVEDDPSSKTGAKITTRVMFPDIEDEEAFVKAAIEGKKKLKDKTTMVDESNGDQYIAERLKDSARGVRDVGLALAGYDELPAVPRWNKGDKCFLYPDGSVATSEEKEAAVEVRNQAAYDYAIDGFMGKIDLVQHTVYASLKHVEFKGQMREEIGYLRPTLPMDAKLLGVA